MIATLADELRDVLATPCAPGAPWPSVATLVAQLQSRSSDPIPVRITPGYMRVTMELTNPCVPSIELEDDSRGWFTTATLKVAAGTVGEVAQIVGPMSSVPRMPGGLATLAAYVDCGTHQVAVFCRHIDDAVESVMLRIERLPR
jgi:hypothetical protein